MHKTIRIFYAIFYAILYAYFVYTYIVATFFFVQVRITKEWTKEVRVVCHLAASNFIIMQAQMALCVTPAY